MRIQLWEPPKRRLRIKNRTRLVVFLLIVLLTILAFIIPKQGVSQVNYVPYKVGYGEYYWHIAKRLQEAGYKKDIRDIVDELIQKSGIPAHELREGDIIYIPDLKVNEEVKGQ